MNIEIIPLPAKAGIGPEMLWRPGTALLLSHRDAFDPEA
jgi:hypothetical protein